MAVSTYFNRVKYTPVAAGTVDFVTSVAVTGFLTPATAGITNGAIVSYVAFSSNQTEWETGQGTYTSGTTTLARTTVRESSNAGAKVNFTAAPTVALDLQAQDIITFAPLISPSFTTPALGVATATSLAIGGATIGSNALAVTGTSALGATTILAASDTQLVINAATGQQYTSLYWKNNNVQKAFAYWDNTNAAFAIGAGVGGGIVTLMSGVGITAITLGSTGNLVTLNSASTLFWSTDTNLSRNAAGIIQFGTTAANASGAWLAAKGTLTAGGTLSFSSGTNQRAGNAVLVGGTVTVSNTTVTANTVVVLTRKTSGGTIGTAITYTLSAGASFTINSDSVIDTSTFSYILLEVP